ncbi:hypothetical protein PRNP1_000687 [Phytophthora ramorum]
MTSEGDVVDDVCVRYACKCGHLAPVSSLFYSETCEKLVCRLPGCSVEEFESYYCGNLLVNLPSKEASMYQNRSSRCFSCPTCENALSTAFHESEQRFFFLCAHCRWESLSVGLADDDPDALVMTAITRERQAAHEDIFQALHSHYSTLSSSPANGGAAGVLSASSGVPFGRSSSLQLLADSMKELQREHQMKKFRLQRMAEMGGWKYDQALAKVEEKERWLMEQRREHQWPELSMQLSALSKQGTSYGEESPEKTREVLRKLSQKCDMGEVSTLHQRLLNPLDQAREADQLFPSRPLLRVKRTWRCVESIERGTAGILVKPQISPMSGDSSLPVSASWFKKANLAAQYVPVVTFQRLPYRVGEGGGVECILLVENPLDDAIRITFHSTPTASEDSNENGHVDFQDLTPIIVGPYEDPNLADAFIDDEPPFGANGDEHNTMLLQATRNLIKIKLPLSVNAATTIPISTLSARFIMDTEKFDEDANEVIENSLLSVPVVASGKYHTLMLSESAAVFSSGDNSYGALGVANLANAGRSVPAKVETGQAEIGGCVQIIAASGFASFALVVLPTVDSVQRPTSKEDRQNRGRLTSIERMARGRLNSLQMVSTHAKLEVAMNAAAVNHLLSWGRGDYGVLGHGDAASSAVPRVLKIFNSMRVTGVSAGLHHVLVLTELDGVYAFGDGSSGKLGMGDINPRLSPTRITSLDGLNVVHISAGDEHSVVMAGETFFNRQVYSWGLGKNGRLGHNDELNRLKPTRVNFFRGRKVITVVAGGAHNLATSEMPQGVCVWSWGAGSYGQLGHRDTWDALIPGSVDEIRHETIRFIDAGQRHSLAISASKQLWLWGQGIHGDYDVPDPDASSTSILYPIKIDLPELSLISARAGRGRTFIWGDRAIEREKPRPFGGTAAQSMCRSLPDSIRSVLDVLTTATFNTV